MIGNNFQGNVIWHTHYIVLRWRLAGSDNTPTISHIYGLITLVI